MSSTAHSEQAPRVQPIGSTWKSYRQTADRNAKRLGREYPNDAPIVLVHRHAEGEDTINEWTIGEWRKGYDAATEELVDLLKECSSSLGRGSHKYELRAEKSGAPVKKLGFFNVSVYWPVAEEASSSAAPSSIALEGMETLIRHLQQTIKDERATSQQKDTTIAKIVDSTSKQIAAVLERNALLEAKLARESDERIKDAEERAREAAELAANAPPVDDMMQQAIATFGPMVADALSTSLAPELRALAVRMMPELASEFAGGGEAAEALEAAAGAAGDSMQ